MQKLVISIATVALIFSANIFADKAETIKRRTIAAEAAKISVDGVVKKQVFKYGDIELLLRDDGSWEIEGLVSHNRLLCSTYELGLRFGTAENSCVNVNWLSEPLYVTTHKQCNSATMVHKADGILENFAGLEKISCAQINIKCTGRCN